MPSAAEIKNRKQVRDFVEALRERPAKVAHAAYAVGEVTANRNPSGGCNYGLFD